MSQFPPTSQAFSVPAIPPAWPKVIGIFSIIWGSLAVLCGACGAAMTIGMEAFLQWAASLQAQSGNAGARGQLPTGPIPAELKMNAVSIVGSLISPIGGVLLLVAGIMLVRRVAAGRTLHLAYAGVSLLGTLLGAVGAVMQSNSAQAYIAANKGDAWADFFAQQSGGPGLQMIQAIVVSVLAAIYPLFVLVWFLAVKRTPESMGANTEDQLI